MEAAASFLCMVIDIEVHLTYMQGLVGIDLTASELEMTLLKIVVFCLINGGCFDVVLDNYEVMDSIQTTITL